MQMLVFTNIYIYIYFWVW